MNYSIIIELIGYLGSILVVISMLMTSVKALRIVNGIGSVIFAGYAIIIHSYPTAFMNFFLVIINVVNLVKLIKAEKTYTIVECYKDESIVQLYLNTHLEDIKKFFPEFNPKESGHILTFIVSTGSTPVGITIGKLNKDFSFSIELDYTIPAYRDCSVGKFLYDYLIKKWSITELVYENCSTLHAPYLEKMGFKKSEKGFVKQIES